MSNQLEFVYASGGLVSQSVLANALSDSPSGGDMRPAAFAYGSRDTETPSQHAETVETAFQLLCERYDAIAADIDCLDTSTLREKWLVPLLSLLDFEPTFQRARLKSSDGRETFDITHLGWNAEDAPPLVLVPGPLDDAAAGAKRCPHMELQVYLNRSNALWGIAANARELRLLRDFHHTTLKAYVGFDLNAIFATRDFQSFRALYRLAHRSRLVPREDGKCILEALFEKSQAEGVQVGKVLRDQVQTAIEALAEGLLSADVRAAIADPKESRAVYEELLLLIYRIMFLLFAEQRRMLPAEGIYAETYSLTTLARIAETRSADPHHCDLWEGLKATFLMLSKGAPAIGVFPYNGRLFDPGRTPRLVGRLCENRYLLEAVSALTQVTVSQGRTRLRQRVNYAAMGVEELGSVYESLLNYSVKRADAPIQTEAGRMVPKGGVYLAPLTTERKDLGAYYTPPELVDFVLEVSLDRLIAERLEKAGKEAEARERALLDLRICDPACGSGAFLVGAVDRIALALAGVRSGGGQPTERTVQLARRDVLRHCIYGVDKDPFAVELCKVALWIHCAVPDLPLSFLDHRIQHGDSLVGWPLLKIPPEIPASAYTIPSSVKSSRDPADVRLKAFLANAGRQNEEALHGQLSFGAAPPAPDVRVDFPAVMAEDERVPADVERKQAAYEGYLDSESYRRFKAAADLWAASFFWSPDAGAPAPTVHDYRRALEGTVDAAQAQAAEELLSEFPAFHWPLRFPEIRARGGFDGFLGNPPWEQVKLNEREWFGPRRSDIAEMTTDDRRNAIAGLAITAPALHRQWTSAVVSYKRLAEYMRTSERFTASGHEPNTYLLFAELLADSMAPTGRSGVVVKSALALDKSASDLFHKLLDRGQLAEFHDIVNALDNPPVFPAVAAVERFAVVGLAGASPRAEFEATIMNGGVAPARTQPRMAFSRDTLRTLNPNTETLTSFRNQPEREVALDIHSRDEQLPILDCERGGSNPWGIEYVTLFHSSGGQKHFVRRENLERDGWELGADMIFRRAPSEGRPRSSADRGLFSDEGGTGVEEALPVYEGQLANRYDHRARSYARYEGDRKYGMKPYVPYTTDAEKADPRFEMEPRYWMLRTTADARIAQRVGDRAIVGFRDVGAPWTNPRSAKAAIIPRWPATDKLPVFAVDDGRVFEFLGMFNSTVFDFLVRGHMPAAGVKLWILAQIPAPRPGLDPRIGENARKLSLTSWSVARLFEGAEPHPWDPEERYWLDVETDALMAHAYGVTRDQYEIILDSFEVMARAQTKQHGRYKFQDDCLEWYGRI